VSLGIINCKIERSIGMFASFCPANSKTTLSKRLKAEGLTGKVEMRAAIIRRRCHWPKLPHHPCARQKF
jgi:hypothetical protein